MTDANRRRIAKAFFYNLNTVFLELCRNLRHLNICFNIYFAEKYIDTKLIKTTSLILILKIYGRFSVAFIWSMRISNQYIHL